MSLTGIDTNFTLPPRYYTSTEIFEEELERIFYSRWIYVACEADIPKPGDWVALKIGKRSFFLQRNASGEVRGFYNVCRHRGHELVAGEKGNCRRLICPYHNWTYDLDGNLQVARGMDPGFPKEDFGLNPIEVAVIGGLIYVCLSTPAPADIEEVRSLLTPYLAPYELPKTKIACQKDIIEACNWKLLIENNRECLHCNSNHAELMVPLYSSGFGKGLDKDNVEPDERRFQEKLQEKESEWDSLGLPYELIEYPDGLWFRTVRLPLANQCISHTLKPEHACKKLLGSFKRPEGSGLSLWTHPNSWNHFLSDHIVTFAVFPLSVDRTLVRTKWLVATDAVESVDYDIENLTKVWTQTNAQDQSLVEGAYRGICSGGYIPGPLADEEYLVKQFLSWYSDQLTENPNTLMPKIVIIGAGIVGCSLADELTERGYSDIVVIEKGKLWNPGGSTSHAPGVVFQTNGSRTMAQFAQQTVEKLYSLEHNGETCFLKVGSLEIATTPNRLADLHRRAGLAIQVGINARVVSADEALHLHPLLDRNKLLGALYVPDDGIARAKQADEVMGKRSISRGAQFISDCEVLAIDQDDGRVTGVQTTQGSFPADIVVSCAGIWGPKIGAMVGMSKAIQPLAHQLCYTAPMPELASYKSEAELPVLRHQGSDLYFKQRGQSLAVGWYGHRPLPVRSEDILPSELAEIMPSQMSFTPEEWKGAMEAATEVIPSLKNAKITESMNGLFSFTVDNFPLMGEWSGLKGFWVAEAVWITHGCGVARAMAEWIVNGHPSIAVHECDVNRFETHQLGPQHIEERGAQNYIEVYDLLHPLQPMESPRPIRTTGFYQRQQELGGFFLEAAGYERPQWYEANAALLTRYKSPPRDEWSSKYWSPVIGAEACTVRDGIGLFDITTLKRIEVIGKGALEFLERMTTGNLRKKPGSITYCLLLNDRAGIMSDITVMRRGEHDFFIGVNSNIDINYLKQSAPDTVHVKDITAGTVGLGLFGPKSRELAQSLTRDNLSNEALGYFKLKNTHLGHVPVMLCRLSYVGELGYEIYTTADFALKLWDTLWQAGKKYGLIAAGRGAFNSMRLEKGYRSYGQDMNSEHNPHEAGLSFAVRKSGGYRGAEALNKINPDAVSRRLVCLVLENPEHVVLGKEPVLHDGKTVGYVTSAYFGHTIDKQLAYAWVPATLSTLGTKLSIRYFDHDYPAAVGQDPQFDPQMTRLRS